MLLSKKQTSQLEYPATVFSWQYVLYVGGVRYTNSEISNSTSISMSCSGDGIDIGDVVGFSLSSQVKDKNGVISKGAFVGLFYLSDENEIPIFTGVISNYTIDRGLLSFTAVDVIAFTDNDYTMSLSEEEIGKSGGMQLPIGEQYKAANSLLTAYTGMGITVPVPSVANMFTADTGWNIRELFSKCAIFEGKNYYVEHSISTLTSQKIVSEFGNYIGVSAKEHSTVSISSTDITIDCVQVSDKDNTEPILIDGLTYEDWGIFRYTNGQPTPAGTKKYVCPFITKDNKDTCGAQALLGYSNGCSFSCENVLFTQLQPPYTQIEFMEMGDAQPAFYIMQANYRLSRSGLIASVSGTTKSLTDAEFIGQNQKDLQKRIMLDVNYGYVSVHMREGIVWDDTDVEEQNSDEESSSDPNKEETTDGTT